MRGGDGDREVFRLVEVCFDEESGVLMDFCRQKIR